MSAELEKRLRELMAAFTRDEWEIPLDALVLAARIGAELEREACALRVGVELRGGRVAEMVQKIIRSRGGK